MFVVKIVLFYTLSFVCLKLNSILDYGFDLDHINIGSTEYIYRLSAYQLVSGWKK